MEQITTEAGTRKKTGGARLKKDENAPKRSKKILWIALAVLLVIAAGNLVLGLYALRLDTFWTGSSILGHDVSGLTVPEAAARLETALPETTLFLYDLPQDAPESQGYIHPGPDIPEDAPAHHTVRLSDLGMEPDALLLAQGAFDAQQHTALFRAGKEYIDRRRTACFSNYYGGDLLTLDEQKAAEAAADAANALSVPPLDASYTLGEASILLQVPKDGIQIDEAALTSALCAREWLGDLSLRVPRSVVPAKVLTAQEIYDTVSVEMKNAGYDAKTDTILPEHAAARFDVAAAQAALDAAQPGETVELPAEIQRPAVTAEVLKDVLFRDVLGEAKTKVGGTSARKSNVRLSASAINGYVMNSGDVFSYNEAVGKRTAERGYQAAPAYVKGETVDEIGGGICQTSSTLYLACLRSNLAITERYAHRYIPAYIPAGMDATVSWGGPDYKFTNNTDYPVKIVTSYEGSYLTVKLLGTNATGITAKMTNEKLSTTSFEVVYEEDDTLAPGTEKVKTTPYTGSKWRTFRHLYDANGKWLSSDYEATSDYKARNKVILKGPAPEVPAVNPELPPEQTGTPETPSGEQPLPEEPPAGSAEGSAVIVVPETPEI